MAEAWERLQAMYAGLADEEVLRLARGRGDLTEAAQAAVDAEMARRGLAVAEEEPEGDDAPVALTAAEDDPSQVLLWYFPVVSEAWAAADLLGERGIEVRVEPAWTRLESKREMPEEMDPATHGVADPRKMYRDRVTIPGVNVYIDRGHQEEAVALLRERMGLFPAAEVDERDGNEVGDDVLFPVGEFASDEDAAGVESALRGAGIRVQVVREDGIVAVMVPFEDLEKATAVMEAAIG